MLSFTYYKQTSWELENLKFQLYSNKFGFNLEYRIQLTEDSEGEFFSAML